MDTEAVLSFLRALQAGQQHGTEEAVLYDEESGKLYRIGVRVEAVPAYLRQTFSSRYGLTGKRYVSWPRRFVRRIRHTERVAHDA